MAQSRPLPLVVTTAPWATHIVLQSEAATQIWRSYLIDDDIFDETRRRLRRALQDVNAPAFGGFDISMNEHETEEYAPYWAPHAFILVPSRPLRRREARFREWFLWRCSNASPDFHPRL